MISIVLVNRLRPVIVYLLVVNEHTEPVSEPVHVVVAVKSLGIVSYNLRRVGSGGDRL